MAKNLYVGNLPWDTNDDDLSKYLISLGINVRSVRVVKDQETGRSRGFAFVEVPQDKLQEVVDDLNGRVFNSRSLVVSVARPREVKPQE
jgi:RNA recognition motif-containing protein